MNLQKTDSKALDALGNPVRRQILRLLAEKPHSVGDITRNFQVSRPAISKHLRLLEGAGLVSHNARGNRNVYELQARGFEEAREWLQNHWSDALTRLLIVAENTAPDKKNV